MYVIHSSKKEWKCESDQIFFYYSVNWLMQIIKSFLVGGHSILLW